MASAAWLEPKTRHSMAMVSACWRSSTINGKPRNNLARLHAEGSLDRELAPNADFAVFALTKQADGKLVVGGDFTSIGGQPRHYLARLRAGGKADANHDPGHDPNNERRPD